MLRQLAELEFEVLNASGLAEAELKLTNVEFTPDGFETRPVAGSRLIVGTGAQKPVGADYGKAHAEVLYKVSANGNSDYAFDGGGFDALGTALGLFNRYPVAPVKDAFG